MQTLVDTTIQSNISVGDLTWEDFAACRGVENAADLFFSEDIGEIAAAKRVCAECPVLAECLEGEAPPRTPPRRWGALHAARPAGVAAAAWEGLFELIVWRLLRLLPGPSVLPFVADMLDTARFDALELMPGPCSQR